MIDTELFPLTLHCMEVEDGAGDIQVPPVRPKNQTIYFGPKSGYRCHSCGSEYYNIRHLNTHVQKTHNFIQKMLDWVNITDKK